MARAGAPKFASAVHLVPDRELPVAAQAVVVAAAQTTKRDRPKY